MAYNGPSNVKDNFGRFQDQATINLTKKMKEIAKTTQKNLREDIAKELLKNYKENVLASYEPRGDGSYEHTDNTFLDSIDVAIEEESGIGRDRVKIVIDKDKVYKLSFSRRTVGQVYKFLTEGAAGGSRKGGDGIYKYKDEKTGVIKYAYNFPTPPHDFELWTQLHMKGYLESLIPDVERGKYSK